MSRQPLRLCDLAYAVAHRRPEAVFLTWAEGRCTYAEAAAAITRQAELLVEAGYAGGRIGLMLPNRPELVITWLAAMRAGVMPVFLNPQFKPAEVETVCDDLDLDLVIAEPGAGYEGRPVARPGELPEASALELPPRRSKRQAENGPAAASVGAVVLTSGSTGRPKYVAVPHEAYVLKATLNALLLAWRPDDRAYGVMPLFHVGAQVETLAPAIAAGARVDLIDRFSASGLWRDLNRLGTTHLHGTGSLLAMAVARGAGEPPTKLTRIVASFRPDLVRELEALIPAADLITLYGLTECPLGTLSKPGEDLTPGWIGYPYTGSDGIRVVGEDGRPLPEGEQGEIQFRNAACTLGYLGPEAPDPFTPDGWLKTGDVGICKHGGFYLSGRIKEMIRRSGENISPAELELAALELAGVAEAAALPQPDPVRDEEVRLVIEAAGRAAELDPAEIRDQLSRRLADYKLPRYIDVVEELPRLASGKLDKPRLAREIGVPSWDYERR